VVNPGRLHIYVCVTDQWLPVKPEGTKRYDRSFLLQLKYVQSSETRPPNLPALPDIVLSEVDFVFVGAICDCMI